MKFKSVVRESHIPDEILITHPWPAVAVREQEIIVTVYGEDIFRQLFPDFAPFLYRELFRGRALGP